MLLGKRCGYVCVCVHTHTHTRTLLGPGCRVKHALPSKGVTDLSAKDGGGLFWLKKDLCSWVFPCPSA